MTERRPNHLLRAARRHACLSREELAEQIAAKTGASCTEQTVKRWENGEVERPYLINQRAACEVLKTTPDKLGWWTVTSEETPTRQDEQKEAMAGGSAAAGPAIPAARPRAEQPEAAGCEHQPAADIAMIDASAAIPTSSRPTVAAFVQAGLPSQPAAAGHDVALALTQAIANRELDYDKLVALLRVMAYHMKRRDFLHRISRAAGIAAATPLAGALDPALNPDEHDRMLGIIGDPSRVDASAIDNVRTILYACRRQDHALGPQAALDTVLAQARLTESMLDGEPSEQLQTGLLSLLAELREFAGSLLFNFADYDSAGRCYEQARSLAHEAENMPLAATVLCNMSRMATWQGKPREGIDYAVAAKGWAAQTASPHVRAYAASVAARAYAGNGQHDLALRELEVDYNELVRAEQADGEDLAPWMGGHNLSSRPVIEAQCAVARSDAAAAISAADRALAKGGQIDIRADAHAVLYRAEAYIQQHEIEAACADLARAADLLAYNSSVRARVRLREVKDRIAPGVRTGALRELDELLASHGLNSSSDRP